VVGLFDHVGIRVVDRPASERFYSTVLGTLGIEQTYSDEELVEWGDDFALSPEGGERPVTRRLHIGFAAPSRELVDRFWTVGTEAGYRDDGAPGARPQYREDYYGGFLLDPDGNSVEAVHHALTPAREGIDHVWMRIADVDAARRFYETIAPHAGFAVRALGEDHLQCVDASGSLSLVVGERPSENVHIAFGSADEATVDAFHRAATSAGYRDNGGPGERPEYHPGYYGAFVLDPDGNNIEVVCHNR
jgi:catechol 2,3-dioxygenase-like lactoylglutathione lyase family enzyme